MKLFCRSRALSYFFGIALIVTGFVTPVFAQTITTIQPISFGTIAIADYTAVAHVTIETDGSGTTNGNAYFLAPPTRGEYQITGGPANFLYTVTLPPSVTLSGPGGTMVMDNFVVLPTVLGTNAAGEDTFFITGRLQTQGGGVFYNDGTYNTIFQVTVAF